MDLPPRERWHDRCYAGDTRAARAEHVDRDLLSFLGATPVLLVVALPAGWLPARRASSLEPMRALREQ